MVTIRRGTPMRCRMEVAATASGGERLRPAERRDEHPRRGRDRGGRREDEPDREQPDRPRVPLVVLERREDRGDVEQRRQEDDEDDVRPELDRRKPRDEADRDTAEHHQDRRGDADAASDRREGRDDDQEPEHDVDVVHAR
jgi:hypothetical protein